MRTDVYRGPSIHIPHVYPHDSSIRQGLLDISQKIALPPSHSHTPITHEPAHPRVIKTPAGPARNATNVHVLPNDSTCSEKSRNNGAGRVFRSNVGRLRWPAGRF